MSKIARRQFIQLSAVVAAGCLVRPGNEAIAQDVYRRGGYPTLVDQPDPQDPKRRCPDIGRAMTLLGWVPKVELGDGLRRTLTWFVETHGNKSADSS